MASPLLERHEPVAPPSQEEQRAAGEAVRALTPFRKSQKPLRLNPENPQNKGDVVELPAVAVELLLRLLKDLAAGNAVMLIPIHAELTTQQAADMLGVSRPFILKQIQEGAIKYRMVGTHRRILFEDLIAYRDTLLRRRSEALDALVKEAQEDGEYAG